MLIGLLSEEYCNVVVMHVKHVLDVLLVLLAFVRVGTCRVDNSTQCNVVNQRIPYVTGVNNTCISHCKYNCTISSTPVLS